MSKYPKRSRAWPIALCALTLLVAGCATKFAPAAYSPFEDGHAKITTAKTVILCSPFDRIDKQDRVNYDPKFNPPAYVQVMLEKELEASGLAFSVATFSYDPSFDGLAKLLSENTVVADNNVVLACAITWFPSEFCMSCDIKLYSNIGVVLYEKRGLCMNLRMVNAEDMKHTRDFMYFGKGVTDADVQENRLYAARMVMQQIFADPDFQKAIQ